MRKNGLEKKKTGLRLRRHSGDTKTQAGLYKRRSLGRRYSKHLKHAVLLIYIVFILFSP